MSEEEVERLRAKVAELESTLKRTRASFASVVGEIFSSFPARATNVESGAVSPILYRRSSPRIEICFGRRFPTPPKVTCWAALRVDSELLVQ
jgi:hypothetical protein